MFFLLSKFFFIPKKEECVHQSIYLLMYLFINLCVYVSIHLSFSLFMIFTLLNYFFISIFNYYRITRNLLVNIMGVKDEFIT